MIVVFTMKGCSHCLEYKPRFERVSKQWMQQNGVRIPIIMADANDPRFDALATRLNVEAVPVTFVLKKPAGTVRVDGAAPDAQIAWLLGVAARHAGH